MCFFAAARELVGEPETQLELPADGGTAAVVETLLLRYPQLAGLLPRCALAINGDYVRGECSIKQGDEVAVLPPMSGG